MTEEQRKAEEAKRESERQKQKSGAKKDRPGKPSGWTYDNHPLIIRDTDEDAFKPVY